MYANSDDDDDHDDDNDDDDDDDDVDDHGDDDGNIGWTTLQCMTMYRVDRSRQRHIGFDQKRSKEPS